MKQTWFQKEQAKKRMQQAQGAEHTREHEHHEKAIAAAGTPAWLLELIAIIEAVLKALPVASPESEANRAELNGKLDRLKAGFPK